MNLVIPAIVILLFPLATYADSSVPETVNPEVFSRVNCQADGMAEKIHAGENVVRTKTVSFPFTTLDAFKNIWTVWDKKEQDALKSPSGGTIMQAIAKHYGLFIEPSTAGKVTNDGDSLPLGLTLTTGKNGAQEVSVNCFACHATMINNHLVIGAGNPKFDFQMLLQDSLREVALANNQPINTFADQIRPVPTGLIAGRMNADQVISVVAAAFRQPNMDLVPPAEDVLMKAVQTPQADVDPQPWWNARQKRRFMWDGQSDSNAELRSADFMSNVVAIKGIGVLGYSGEEIRNRRGDLHLLYAYSMCADSPKPTTPEFKKIIGPVDLELAAKGKKAYEFACARCHGTYGDKGELTKFPDVFTELDELKTDRVRYDADSELLLNFYRGFPSEIDDANGNVIGKADVSRKKGYQAPPLTGIWASAPYFHNGSAPTLDDVLNHQIWRPTVWKIVDDPANMYDQEKVGLKVERFSKVPDGISEWERRKYFDASLSGASVNGHLYGSSLSESRRKAILEYLKTL